MTPTVRVTAKQIRFVLASGGVWAVQPLHVPGGVPAALRGNYAVPTAEQRRHAWGDMTGAAELKALRAWVARGYKVP